MTDAKFCDIHVGGNNVVPKDRTMSIVLERYDTSLGQKVGRKGVYLQLAIDGCIPCITEKILKSAKDHGLDVENAWKVEVLLPPKLGSKSKRWTTAYMTPAEYIEHMKKQEAEQVERAERERATVAPTIPAK